MTGRGSRGRRVLVLSPFAPRRGAAHGGGRVIAEFICELAVRNEVGLLYFRAPEEEGPDDDVARSCALVEEVARPRLRLRKLRLFMRLLFQRQPIWAAEWRLDSFAKRMEVVTARWRPDVVQAEYHVMAQYFGESARADALCIVDLHEPGLRSAEARARLGGRSARIVAALDARAWKRYERKHLGRAHAVVVFAAEDRCSLGHLDQGRVFHIPLAVPLAPAAASSVNDREPNVLFVGSYAHPPNVDAAQRLATSIMPLVRSRLPSTNLLLVGERPPPDVQRLTDHGIVVTGRVGDVRPYFDSAAVVVAPMRLGGGVRIKVLEALAAGKAVVATPLAVAGLDVADGRELLLASSDEELADAICSLLADPDERAAIGARARAWARRRPGWPDSIALLEELYETRGVAAPASRRTTRPSGS